MLESTPDSALQMIYSIECPERLRHGVAAHYALVRTMAEAQYHHSFTSDSLIQIAVNYYGTHSGLQSALSYYCWGCVSSAMGDDECAAEAYLRAKSLFPDKRHRYYGLASNNLGMLYYKKNMYEKALDEFHEAQSCLFSIEGAPYNMPLIYNWGLTYLAADDYDNAATVFSQIAHDESVAAHPFRLKALHQLADVSYHQRKYFAANYYINRCIRLSTPEELFAGVYATKGNVLVVREELDSALYYYRKGLEYPYEAHSYAAIYNGMADVFRFQNTMDSVKHYQKLAHQLNKSIDEVEYNDRMYTVLSQFKVEQALADRETLQRQQRHARYRAIAVFLCFIVGLAVLLVWLVKRYKRRYSYTLHCLAAYYPFLLAVVHSYRTSQHLLQSAAQASPLQLPHGDSFAEILQSCAENFKSAALYDELFSLQVKESELVQLHHYPHSDELRKSLFVHFEPVIRELCAHVRLSDKHIIHCLCRYLGIPTATIAHCLHTTVRSLSKDKTRLLQKLPENYATTLLGNSSRRGRPKSL